MGIVIRINTDTDTGADSGTDSGADTELAVRPDALEGRTGATNTDLRIGEYGFFAPEHENRYSAAREGGQARLEGLMSQPFTASFPKEELKSGAEQLRSLPILETAPEYTQGLYDEAGAGNEGLAMIALIIAAICVVTFLATRAWHRRKREEAE